VSWWVPLQLHQTVTACVCRRGWWRDIHNGTQCLLCTFRSIAQADSSWECSMLKPGASSCRSSASDWGSFVRRKELLQDMMRRTLGSDVQVGNTHLT
jgi:hypothetical protein